LIHAVQKILACLIVRSPILLPTCPSLQPITISHYIKIGLPSSVSRNSCLKTRKLTETRSSFFEGASVFLYISLHFSIIPYHCGIISRKTGRKPTCTSTSAETFVPPSHDKVYRVVLRGRTRCETFDPSHPDDTQIFPTP
jgi:hypothetical protein